MTAISVESDLAVLGFFKAMLRALKTLMYFCLAATITVTAGDLCMLEIPAMPIAVITPGKEIRAEPKSDLGLYISGRKSE